MFNKKYKSNELIIAQIIQVDYIKSTPTNSYGGYVTDVTYKKIKFGIFKKIDNNHYFHITSGITFNKLDFWAEKDEYYVNLKNHQYLPFLLKGNVSDKISLNTIKDLENKLNTKTRENQNQNASFNLKSENDTNEKRLEQNEAEAKENDLE